MVIRQRKTDCPVRAAARAFELIDALKNFIFTEKAALGKVLLTQPIFDDIEVTLGLVGGFDNVAVEGGKFR